MLLDDKLFYQLSVLHRLFRKDAQEQLNKEVDATLEMQGILHVLFEFGPLPQQKIADLLHVEKSTMKRNIDKLQQRNYVSVDKDSPKSRIVTLTETGNEVREKSKAILERQEACWLEPFSQAEQERMLVNIKRMVDGRLASNSVLPTCCEDENSTK